MNIYIPESAIQDLQLENELVKANAPGNDGRHYKWVKERVECDVRTARPIGL